MRFFSRAKQQPGWLALCVTGKGVNFAHVRRTAAGRPEVLRCEFHPLRHEFHSLQAPDAQGLARIGKEARFDQFYCTTLLNPGEYQMLQVEAPNVPKEELKAAIRWRIKDLLNYHVDDAMVDVLDIPLDKNAPSRNHSMYAVAVPNEVIQKRVSLFEEAGIPLLVIDIPEMAQRNMASLFERADRGLALLSFDNDGGLLTFTHAGELYVARRLEVSLAQLNDADAALRKQSFDRVVLELQRSFDHFDRNYNFIPLAQLLLAPLPQPIGLEEYLTANLPLPVEMLNLPRVLDFAATPELNDAEAQGRCFQLLGAALRHEKVAL